MCFTTIRPNILKTKSQNCVYIFCVLVSNKRMPKLLYCILISITKISIISRMSMLLMAKKLIFRKNLSFKEGDWFLHKASVLVELVREICCFIRLKNLWFYLWILLRKFVSLKYSGIVRCRIMEVFVGFIFCLSCADWRFICNFARKSLDSYGAREYFR